MKQTALDFLLSHIPDIGKDMIGRDVIREAKELEKQHLINAYDKGESNWLHEQNNEHFENGEGYYNNTFNQ
jgi:hypothetical protein